jgi:hypothetical protein
LSRSGVENFASRNAPDIVGKFDRSGDFRISEFGLAGFLDVIFDAGYAIARQGSAERNEFMFAGAQRGFQRLSILCATTGVFLCIHFRVLPFMTLHIHYHCKMHHCSQNCHTCHPLFLYVLTGRGAIKIRTPQVILLAFLSITSQLIILIMVQFATTRQRLLETCASPVKSDLNGVYTQVKYFSYLGV